MQLKNLLQVYWCKFTKTFSTQKTW